MGIEQFLTFVEKECPATACQEVDLLRIGREFLQGRRRGHLRLILDAESCLDRLYGGFYSDWACGGQWNRMTNFLTTLMRACQSANIELVVFFNGALESERLREWYHQQVEYKKHVTSVFKHINNKATPPPKVWWIPPVCLRASLRMALRQMGVAVACSMDDHHQEVIAYCRECAFHGLVAQDSDYAIFDPPRYFSSQHLKLTYKGSLETKEYIMDRVAESLDLNPKRFCVFAALLGNHILPEEDLQEFFHAICTKSPDQKISSEEIIRAVLTYVRGLPTVDDLDALGKDVFKYTSKANAEKVNSFKQSVQYYLNGTQDGFLKYRPKPQVSTPTRQPGSYPSKTNGVRTTAADSKGNKQESKKETAEEEDVKDLKADKVYTEGESGYATESGHVSAPEIVIDPPSTAQADLEQVLASEISECLNKDMDEKDQSTATDKMGDSISENHSVLDVDQALDSSTPKRAETHQLTSVSSSSSSSSGSSPQRLSPDTAWMSKLKTNAQSQDKSSNGVSDSQRIPKIAPEIMRIASERHQKGLMMPWIYQTLSQGEVKIPVSLEDENNKELLSAVELYRPVRQNIYAILFDLNKKCLQAKSNPSQYGNLQLDIYIKEWMVPNGPSIGATAELVRAQPLDWKVPSVHRLWLGQAIEDKNRRLRAFLTCMRSDTPMMLNTSYVPQHLLILCCVLRYMLVYKEKKVLRRHELDAFLATAVSPLLHDVDTMQDMKLPMITARGIQLASLFMHGVETAMFANDACGAPIPWAMCCPWLFFDGKLFHFKLLKANNNTPLIDICDGHMDMMMKVERMRNAILENIRIETAFAKPPLSLMSHPQYDPMYPPGGYEGGYGDINFRPAGASIPPMAPGMMGRGMSYRGRGVANRGRGLLGHSPVDSRGGQLQIAGVVVGNWGGNTNTGQRPRGRGTHVAPPPHVTSVGPRSRGSRGVVATLANRGRGYGGRPGSYGGRGMPKTQIPAQRFYNSGGRGNFRGSNNRDKPKSQGGSQGQSVTQITLEQRTKVEGVGRGRGCTVESPTNGHDVVSVSQLLKSTSLEDKTIEVEDQISSEQFEDASSVPDIADVGAMMTNVNGDLQVDAS